MTTHADATSALSRAGAFAGRMCGKTLMSVQARSGIQSCGVVGRHPRQRRLVPIAGTLRLTLGPGTGTSDGGRVLTGHPPRSLTATGDAGDW
jgi:hypothetical protein